MALTCYNNIACLYLYIYIFIFKLGSHEHLCLNIQFSYTPFTWRTLLAVMMEDSLSACDTAN